MQVLMTVLFHVFFQKFKKNELTKKNSIFQPLYSVVSVKTEISALDGHQIIAVSYEIDIRSKEYNEAKRIDGICYRCII